jgi:hypothetical protein
MIDSVGVVTWVDPEKSFWLANAVAPPARM